MSKDQRITVLALLLAVSTFLITDVALRYHLSARYGVEELANGRLRRITLDEARDRAIRDTLRIAPFAALGILVLLTVAWPFASFFRHGPRAVGAVVGLALGGLSGFLVVLPAGPWAGLFLQAVLAGAVLFGILGAAMPRKPL